MKEPKLMTAEKMLKRKKPWTGAELGALEIESTLIAEEIHAQSGGSPEGLIKEQLIKKEDLWTVLETLPPHEYDRYIDFIHLHDWLNVSAPQSYSDKTEALAYLGEYSKYIFVALQAECICRGLSLTKSDHAGFFTLPQSVMRYAFLPTFSIKEPDTVEKGRIKQIRARILKYHFKTKCFNLILDLIAKCHKIPHTYVLYRNVEEHCYDFDKFNERVNELRGIIEDNMINGFRPELQAMKLKLLDEYLAPIGYNNIKIPPKNIKHVKNMVTSMSIFRARRSQAYAILTAYLSIGTPFEE